MTDKPAGPATPAVRRLCLVGLSVAGVLGIILAVNSAYSNDFIGAGVCLAASSLACGFLTHSG